MSTADETGAIWHLRTLTGGMDDASWFPSVMISACPPNVLEKAITSKVSDVWHAVSLEFYRLEARAESRDSSQDSSCGHP